MDSFDILIHPFFINEYMEHDGTNYIPECLNIDIDLKTPFHGVVTMQCPHCGRYDLYFLRVIGVSTAIDVVTYETCRCYLQEYRCKACSRKSAKIVSENGQFIPIEWDLLE